MAAGSRYLDPRKGESTMNMRLRARSQVLKRLLSGILWPVLVSQVAFTQPLVQGNPGTDASAAVAFPAVSILPPITNGNFASGNLNGWTRTAFLGAAPFTGGPTFSTFLTTQSMCTPRPDTNAVVAAQTSAFIGGVPGPPITPLHGPFLTFVSNESSIGNLTGSSISQTFGVPAGATTLTFDARLINNDFPTDFNFFDDFGGVALSQGSNILAQYNIDLAGNANAHVTDNANAGGFRNSSQWVSPSFSLAGLAGQNVTVTAYALNYRDNNIESRLLVDNFQVQIANQCVTNYQLVSQLNGPGTQLDLTYKGDFVNTGSAVQSAMATLTSLDPFTIRVFPGQDVLNFGPVPANGFATSLNTFTIIVDSRNPLDLTKLAWSCVTTPGQPVANPGPNRTVPAGTTVFLDASGSTNPSGLGTLTFDWRFTSRPPGSMTRLFFGTSVNPYFVADVPGTYVISLTVSNGSASSTSTVTITAI
jgi:hypothetical protein